MKANVGQLDRMFRIAAALVLAALFWGGVLTGTAGVVALGVAAVLFLTGLFRFCPAYRLCGASSCRREV